MRVLKGLTQRLSLLVMFAGGMVVGIAGTVFVSVQSGSEERLPPLTGTEVPPPPYNRWINPDTGLFNAGPIWDDRPIADAEKAANPWYDPRWKPFSDCMVAAGFDVRPDSDQPFNQRDLDEIVARTNQERPDREANRLIGTNIAGIDGIAGAYLRCAGEWLGLSRDKWLERGIRKLEPGELPEP